MRDLIHITKALADTSRLRLLRALGAGELCVCQLVELLELAPSTVSKHLSQLRQAGLVELRKDGRWIHYRLANEDASPAVHRALDLVCAAAADDPQAVRDEARLTAIRAVDPEVLCGQQRATPMTERRRART